jgi:hypothetical protein
MRLEDLTVALRPRQPWEAADLGCVLVRRDFPRILGLWSATVLPVWIGLALALWDYPTAFALIVWWLKPLYDRVPLHFISRATFGARPGFLATWKQWPRLWSRFLLPSLLWRRLSPSRSFTLPVWLLEGQRGKNLRSRAANLARDGGGSGTSLTWVFLKLEIAVMLGLLALTSFAAPDSGLPNIEDLMDADENFQLMTTNAYYWWLNLWYLVAITIVEPFYVGAGFGLYLNCRTKLEGWDIELGFRRTASRLQRAATTVILLCVLLLPALPALATDSPPPAAESTPATTPADPNAHAKAVLAEPDFQIHSKTDRTWVPSGVASAPPGMIAALMSGFGYVALIVLILFLIIVLMRVAPRLRTPILPAHIQSAAPPRFVLGMEITQESLPTDLIAAARIAWAQSDPKEALSLLYRGALAFLITQHHVPIQSSDTEDDCLARALASNVDSHTSFFRQLTHAWVRTAYAEKPPTATEFDALCSAWPFQMQSAKTSPIKAMAGALALPLLLLLSSCDGHWEDVTRETGYKGPARIDPFLAAARLLEQRDHSTERAPTLAELPDAASGLIFASAENGMPAGRARPILQWVADGGHLVYTLAGASPYNDWSVFSALSSYGYFGNDERPDPVLETLGVTAKDRRTEEEAERERANVITGGKKTKKTSDSSKEKPKPKATTAEKEIEKPEDVSLTVTTFNWSQQPIKVELPDYVTFSIDRTLRNGDFIAGTPAAAHLLSLRHGTGRVTLISHARPLRNRFLADQDHGLLLTTLAGPGSVHALFVVGLEGSFWQLLWERAWRPIIALVLLIVLWLWMSLPRFGPVRHVTLHTTKRFSDHLTTLGSFFLSIRRQDYLIASAQAALQQRLRETHPHLTTQSDQTTLLATRSQLTLDRIQTALSAPQSLPPQQIIRILQDLQKLRHSLS